MSQYSQHGFVDGNLLGNADFRAQTNVLKKFIQILTLPINRFLSKLVLLITY